MTWQLPLFFNIIFGTVRGFLDKKVSDRSDPLVALFYINCSSSIFYLLFYFVRHESFPPVYPEMMLLGVIFAFGIGSYMKAIKINLSQSIVFTSYYLLISMFLSALFLGEWHLFNPAEAAGIKNILGVVLALLSMFLILRAHNKKEEKMEKNWLFLVLVNIVLVGIGVFWGKSFVDTHGPLETIFSQAMACALTLFFINLARRKKMHLSFSNHALSFIDGLVIACGATFYYVAIKAGSLSLILPIQSLVLTVTGILTGLFLFGEAHLFDRAKIIGLALGAAGVVLLVI